jgi:class 3 adenylate cyclase
MTTTDPLSEGVHRRLTVILSSDIAGYSRLVSENEESTIKRLRKISGRFRELVAGYRGRIFNTAGDAILAEFGSAVDAVRCAMDVHEATRTENREFPPNEALTFRIGVSVGDVIVAENQDLLGDGVNIAARLQSLAEPGGTCISNEVLHYVRNKINIQFIDLGPKNLKNIGTPVHVFALGQGTTSPALRKRRSKRSALMVGAIVLAGSLGAVWWTVPNRTRPAPPAKCFLFDGARYCE